MMTFFPHRMFAEKKLGERFHKGRFLYINVWRNISDTPIGIGVVWHIDTPIVTYVLLSVIWSSWCPTGNDHLAVCDETSLVKPDDYIVTDFFDKAYRWWGTKKSNFQDISQSICSLQQYRLLDDNADSHRWFYFPGMKKDEVNTRHIPPVLECDISSCC